MRQILFLLTFILLTSVSFSQNIRVEYQKKEQDLMKKYQLTEQERLIVNKSKGRELTAKEKIIYAKALKKHNTHVKKRRNLQKKQDAEIKRSLKKQ